MNKEVLGSVRQKRTVLDIIRGRKRNWLGQCMQPTQGNVIFRNTGGSGNWNEK